MHLKYRRGVSSNVREDTTLRASADERECFVNLPQPVRAASGNEFASESDAIALGGNDALSTGSKESLMTSGSNPLGMHGMSRREMIAASGAALALAMTAGPAAARNLWMSAPEPEGDDTNVKPADKKLKILVLGGTAFIGPHFVRLALRRGHSVAVFNRGRTEKRIGALPDSVEKLIGDRDPKVGEGLKALDNDRRWDAVIDNSGYYPRIVGASADLLAKRCGQYMFVSSMSAYKHPPAPNADESAPLATLDDPTVEDMGGGAHYGGLKVLCEQAVEKALPGRTVIVRPTFIVGPGDPTDRFSYWPVRVAKGGKMLCPGTPNDPMQFIDVRDLAAFMLTLVENNTMGTFNACGPAPKPGGEASLGAVLTAAKKISKSDAEFVWVPEKFIVEQPEPIDTTIWLPPNSDAAAMATAKYDKAIASGLKNRPVEETVRATLEWWPKEIERRKRVGKELVAQAEKEGKPAPKLGDPDKPRAGMSAELEQRLLERWAEKQKQG
jgi:2'-hydroxyisoflavone reductase